MCHWAHKGQRTTCMNLFSTIGGLGVEPKSSGLVVSAFTVLDESSPRPLFLLFQLLTLALNSWSSCFYFLGAWITGVPHIADLKKDLRQLCRGVKCFSSLLLQVIGAGLSYGMEPGNITRRAYLNTTCWTLPHRFWRSRAGIRVCISNKFPEEADVGGLIQVFPVLEELLLRPRPDILQ